MGAFMVLKIVMETSKLVDWFKEDNGFDIIKMSAYDDETTIFQHGYWGYAEPVELYDKFKDIVKDIWWLSLSDSEELIGRNMNAKWNSAKKEYIIYKEGENNRPSLEELRVSNDG